MTTIQAVRPGTVDLHLRRPSTAGAEAPPVPDHVPADLAAQHPDAASVVSAGRPARGGVRVVSRAEPPRALALRVLALVACAVLAAVTGGSAPAPASVPAAATPSVSTGVDGGGSAAEASPVPEHGCPPGAPVVVRCDPPCAAPSPLVLPLGGCPTRR